MNNGMGVYTSESQFDIDEARLIKLKFTPREIDMLKYIRNVRGRVVVKELIERGVNPELARHVKQAYDICIGTVTVNTCLELKKHLRKMFGHKYRITVNDLKPSNVRDIPRYCVIANLKKPWDIWNSAKYAGMDKFFEVVSSGEKNIKIIMPRRPILKYKQEKREENVCAIEKEDKYGNLLVSINKNYCRLCNRYAIVATLRKPERYIFLVEVICIEGTSIYVFAAKVDGNSKIGVNLGKNRIYGWGLNPKEIEGKTLRVASLIYKKFLGVTAKKEDGNVDYNVICDIKKESYNESDYYD